jgi:serine acetyltransferase/GT2 family glycosyltransferase
MNRASQPPRVSVVVATYQRPAEIKRLLAQLDAQSLPPSSYEVVVVDDGSSADVPALLQPDVHSYSLTVLRQPNAGSAAARQRGAAAATGDLLLFVDDDMHVGPEFLAAHASAHPGSERLVVLGRRRAGVDSAALPLVERYRVRMGDRLSAELAGGLVLTGEYLYTGNVSMPRALFEEAGGFDSGLRQLDDAELGIRLEKAGARFLLSEEAYNVHERDPLTPEQWFERAHRDGWYWGKVGRKHPDVASASPWHWLDVVSPISRPLLLLSSLRPGPAAPIARAAFALSRLASALRLERVAMAGTTFVYGVHMFRGVGEEAGGTRAALREYRAFRRRSGGDGPGSSGSGPFRDMLDAIRADHRMLVETDARYDSRNRDIGSPVRAFVENVGFQLVVCYRIMRFLRAARLGFAARVASRAIRLLYGSDVHWDAELAPGVVVVHGFGMAIAHAARTGTGCILSQHVTLGIGRDPASGATGAPVLGDYVVVGPGAAVIGPIVVGAHSKIMANCVVIESVPPHTVVEAPPVSLRPR